MGAFQITGGLPIGGAVRVQGAKNSALPILTASILVRGVCELHNCPRLTDTERTVEILKALGCETEWNGDVLRIDSANALSVKAAGKYSERMRSSILFLGALTARCGEAEVSKPGGCMLGARPVDMHIDALKRLGAEITEECDRYISRAEKLRGAELRLRSASVGATENILLAAATAKGRTVLRNAAREPEIVDLQNFLNRAGARIHGAGSDTICIEGVERLHDVQYTVMPDRIAAATLLCAAAATGGKIRLFESEPIHYATVLDCLAAMGCAIENDGASLCLKAPRRLKGGIRVSTEPYPGFPTDAQPLLMAAALKAEGISEFTENIFENRYGHIPEMQKMGAEIRQSERLALVRGTHRLNGSRLFSCDLRGGAALIIAALSAEGESRVESVHYVDRGYVNLEETLTELGGCIARAEA